MDYTKTCVKCHQEKSLSEFNKAETCKDGHRNECRVCRNKYKKEYNQTNKAKDCRKRYRQTEKGKATDRQYRLRYPERRRAGSAVSYAIIKGELIPPKYFLCYEEKCLTQAEEYHHYKGYAEANWLEVDAVCRSCHRKIHTRSA